MTNKEKFIEIFGVNPDDNFCPLATCEGCYYANNGCDENHPAKFFNLEYKGDTE